MKTIVRILIVSLCSSAMTLAWIYRGGFDQAPRIHVATALPPPAPKLTIGIAAPHVAVGQPSDAANVAESVRRGLTGSLQGTSVDVIPLQATDPALIEAEAQTRHCNYVLYSAVEQKSSGHGFFKKLAPFASALPLLAGMPAVTAAGWESTRRTRWPKHAMQASAMSAQQAAMDQLAGVQRSTVKSGDTVSFEYRLMQPGNAQPLSSNKFVGKARADGEDVLGPFIAQAVTAVSSAAGAPPSSAVHIGRSEQLQFADDESHATTHARRGRNAGRRRNGLRSARRNAELDHERRVVQEDDGHSAGLQQGAGGSERFPARR